MMTADLRIYDPELQTTPLKLNDGSHIENLNLSIFWKGVSADQGKAPISFSRGSIGQLNWINTPPMYVSSRLSHGNVLTVVFSQDVKAIDFGAGVVISVNGRPVRFATAAHQRGGDSVNYILKHRVSFSDTVTWSYDSRAGMIEDCSGIQLLSVSEKRSDVADIQEGAL